MKNIFVVDDELDMLNSLQKILSFREDFKVKTENNGLKALETVGRQSFDLIITDLKMKEISGIDLLKAALKNFPDSTVIMISGYGTIEASVEAMKEGAFDFIEKPFSSKRLFDCIDRALNSKASLKGEDNQAESNLPGIIYESAKMSEVIGIVKRIAPTKVNVLLTGESGTGKELIARAIHNLSKVKMEPFVPVNCGALPEHLFESELFGHEKGAFTGAVKTKPGLLEFANHGTFFFDEIGDMSQTLQVKLLRMLEERKIRRVGGQSEIDIDVRIIAATNKNLDNAVQENKFRKDLFYRLNTIQIELPPLRDRAEDIVPLATHFLSELCSRDDRKPRRFSKEAEDLLKSYSWPGNVRELQNIIGRAYFLSSSDIIRREDLPIQLEHNVNKMLKEILTLSYKDARDRILEKFEVEYLTYHLRKNKGNISQTGIQCGIDRRSIHRLINKYNIIYKENEN